MEKCPVCLSDRKDSSQICNCGYNFEQKIISDGNKIVVHLKKLSRSDWVEEIKTKKRITDTHIQALGRSSTNPKIGGWSKRKTANLLKEDISLTSRDINLAEYLEIHPDLEKSRNKSEAKKRWDQRLRGHSDKEPIVKLEIDLQKYLEKNWDQISFFKEWKLKGKFNTGEIGEIDLLAQHKIDKRWLVVELKLSQSSDETIGQLLRYIGWVKNTKATEQEVVEGLIISEFSDLRLKYSLEALGGNPVIKIMNYKFENDQVVLVDYKETDFLNEFSRMSKEDQIKVLDIFKRN